MPDKRHHIIDTPHGSPEASEVRVYKVCDEPTCPEFHYLMPHRHLVGTDDAWESDLTPGSTLTGERLDGQDPISYETAADGN